MAEAKWSGASTIFVVNGSTDDNQALRFCTSEKATWM
jgi:hypothetical protein